jgi:hypothetical protein
VLNSQLYYTVRDFIILCYLTLYQTTSRSLCFHYLSQSFSMQEALQLASLSCQNIGLLICTNS